MMCLFVGSYVYYPLLFTCLLYTFSVRGCVRNIPHTVFVFLDMFCGTTFGCNARRDDQQQFDLLDSVSVVSVFAIICVHSLIEARSRFYSMLCPFPFLSDV